MERRVFLATAVSSLSFGCIGFGGPDDNGEDEEEGELDPENIGQITEEEINNAREDEGLEPFEGNETLLEVALNQTEYMAVEGNLSRTDGEGREPSERVEDAGYDCEREATQNAMRIVDPSGLSGDREAALTIVDTLLEEEPTRGRLLDPDRTEHAVAVAVTGEYLYMTQIIC